MNCDRIYILVMQHTDMVFLKI